MTDYHALKQTHNIVDIVARRVELTPKGSELVGLCPFHNDTKKSLQVNQAKQIFKCFACGVGGDMFDWFKALGADYKTELGVEEKPKRDPSEVPKANGKWYYHNEAGEVIVEIRRFDYSDGTKEVKPYTNGKYGLPKGKRTLYNLPNVINADHVYIVEGEKAADAAKKINPATTTFLGGASSVLKTDYAPLTGKRITLWPDNDDIGRVAMLKLAEHLSELDCTLDMIVWPEGTPNKQDAADHPYTIDWVEQHAKPIEADAPFVQLGFVNESGLKHIFYSKGSRTIISLASSSLSKSNLPELAPLRYWLDKYPTKQGYNHDQACDDLIQASKKIGIFNPNIIRGRGAWVDGTNVVIHNGSSLIVNGRALPLEQQSSRYLYELSSPLGMNVSQPMPDEESELIAEFISGLSFSREVDAHLLAGWCVVAPVCGALSWRPHIWLTGAAGTGKSWVFQNVVRAMLGACCLSVQGETSEAGLRQSLGHDAIPVVFDEAEGEDKRNQDRMQAVMALMRAASAEDGGVMAKGTSSGTAKTYRIRSCFAFASIAVQVHQQSDRTRVTVLTLSRPNTTKQQWEDKRRYFTKTFTSDYVQRLQARTVKLLPTILANTKTFARVIAEELGEQRLGDQLAPMFAGRVSLITSDLLTESEARELFKGYEFEDERSLMDTKDEIACLKYLMEQQVVVHNRDDRAMNVAVSELIQAVQNIEGGVSVTAITASEVLSRCGLKIEHDVVFISNTALWVKNALKDTQWAKNHSRILIRIPGAIPASSMRFAGGLVSRAVQIPLNVLYLQ